MAVEARNDMMQDVAELLQKLDQGPHAETDRALDDVVVGLLGHLPAAQYAGVTLTTSTGDVRTLAPTHPYAVQLDDIQRQHREGPCLTAAWQHHVVRLDDICHEERWPAYCRDVAATTPIRSILAFELFVAEGANGALNFYADRPGAFDDEAVEIGLTLATHAALAWHLVQRDGQFRSALASRDVIGQAKGMIMERFDIGAVAAFELLKRLSQNSNVPIADVAQRLTRRSGNR